MMLQHHRYGILEKALYAHSAILRHIVALNATVTTYFHSEYIVLESSTGIFT